MHLDLGCGPSPRDGYEGVDIVAGPGVAWECDLEKFPWKFRGPRQLVAWEVPNAYADSVYSSHFVEHIVDLVGFMAELWRVCKDGAEVHVFHPYAFNVRADQDPTHVRRLNEVSFFYFDQQWRTLNRPEFGPTDFEVVECNAIPEENWKEIANEFPEEFERACRNQINVISDLHWVLRCRKSA